MWSQHLLFSLSVVLHCLKEKNKFRWYPISFKYVWTTFLLYHLLLLHVDSFFQSYFNRNLVRTHDGLVRISAFLFAQKAPFPVLLFLGNSVLPLNTQLNNPLPFSPSSFELYTLLSPVVFSTLPDHATETHHTKLSCLYVFLSKLHIFLTTPGKRSKWVKTNIVLQVAYMFLEDDNKVAENNYCKKSTYKSEDVSYLLFSLQSHCLLLQANLYQKFRNVKGNNDTVSKTSVNSEAWRNHEEPFRRSWRIWSRVLSLYLFAVELQTNQWFCLALVLLLQNTAPIEWRCSNR